MAKHDPFEKKIRDKLEQLSAPEEEGAWEKFSPLLYASSTPFWKHWFLPYLYATGLFLGGLWWYTETQKNTPAERFYQEGGSVAVDTIYRSDTVYLVDTVYVYREIYVKEKKALGPPAGNPVYEDLENGAETQGFVEVNTATGSMGPGLDRLATANPAGVETHSMSKASVGGFRSDTRSGETRSQVDDSLTTGRQEVGKGSMKGKVGGNQPRRRSLAAPAPVGPEEEFVMRTDKELVVGDTSNLNQMPVARKSRTTLHLEAGTSLVFPISRLIEYYTPNQQGVHLGLEWESGWGLYLGAIRNRVEGELDDEEIMALDQALVDGLPEVPQDISSLDEIYLTNRQWFFPLELRWRSPSFAGVSFESGFGLLGNYLSRQDFIYEFENNSELEYQYASDPLRQFTISHLRLGIGTNYLLARRWKLFLRSQYWLPVARTGLLEDRTHGVEVGVGVNFMLRK